MSLQYKDYASEEVAVDIETRDPFLKEKGNGVFRKDGYILGVSFSDGHVSEYYPLEHYDTTGEEFEKNYRFIKAQLARNNHKIFANGLYDLDWLTNGENLIVNGKWDDIQIAEPLLDEYRKSYSLNTLAWDYLKEVKNTKSLSQYKGVDVSVKALWKMPSSAVESYAMDDARLTYEIFQLQKEKLIEEELTSIYRMEMDLFPVLLLMRKNGVRIDKDRLTRIGLELSDLHFDLQEKMDTIAGFPININSPRHLTKLFENLDIPILYGEPTELMYQKGITRGNPVFNKRTLEAIHHPAIKEILKHTMVNTVTQEKKSLITVYNKKCKRPEKRRQKYYPFLSFDLVLRFL